MRNNLCKKKSSVCLDGLPVLVSMLAVSISRGKSIDELQLLAAIFTQLGDSIDTVAATCDLMDNSCDQEE